MLGKIIICMLLYYIKSRNNDELIINNTANHLTVTYLIVWK